MTLTYFDVTARPYNATGNGTTDDATAIKNAIEAAGAAGGGTVFFPQGTYNIVTKITLANLDNVEILCGPGAKFTTPVGTTETDTADWQGVMNLRAGVIQFDKCTNCTWSAGLLDGAEEQGGSGDGGGTSSRYHLLFKTILPGQAISNFHVPCFFWFTECKNFTVRGLRSQGFLRPVLMKKCEYFTVEDFDYEGILDGTFIKGGTVNDDQKAESQVIRASVQINSSGGRDLVFRNCRANSTDATKHTGGTLEVGTTGPNATYTGDDNDTVAERVVIDGSRIRNVHDQGIYLEAVHARVTNCLIDNADPAAVGGLPVAGGIDVRVGRHLLISDNVFKDIRGCIVAQAGGAQSLDVLGARGSHILIANNRMENCGETAVRIIAKVIDQDPDPDIRFYTRDVQVLYNSVRQTDPDLLAGGSDPPDMPAISVLGSDRSKIVGNTIDGWAHDTAVLVGRNVTAGDGLNDTFRIVHDTTISDNTFVNCRDGIHVVGVEGGAVTANRISGPPPAVTGSVKAALLWAHDSSKLFIDGNDADAGWKYLHSEPGSACASFSVGSNNLGAVGGTGRMSVLPSQLPGINVWLRAGDTITVLNGLSPPVPVENNEKVTVWNSRTNGYALAAPSADNRPILTNDERGIGTSLLKPFLTFDGIDDHLFENVAANNLGNPSSGGVFVVFRILSGNDVENGLVSAGRSSNVREWSIRVNGFTKAVTLTVWNASTKITRTGTISAFALNTAYVLHWRSTGGAGGGWLLEVNGANVDIGSPSNTEWLSYIHGSGPSQFAIGAVQYIAATDFANADIAEVVLYDGTPDVGGVERYLADSYGITLP